MTEPTIIKPEDNYEVKNAIILLDDYNFINQEGCKAAINEFGLNIKSCFQTPNGQLIFINV